MEKCIPKFNDDVSVVSVCNRRLLLIIGSPYIYLKFCVFQEQFVSLFQVNWNIK